MRSLHDLWLSDQRLALVSAILCGNGEDGLLDRDALTLLAQATKVVAQEAACENLGHLGEATLALASKIPSCYVVPDEEDFPGGVSLVSALDKVNQEVALRHEGSQRMSSVHLAHAVYLLRQQHLSIRDFFKWLKRSGRGVTPGVPDLPADGSGERHLVDTRVRLDRLLVRSRSADEQARDRLDAVDELHALVNELMGGPAERKLWWTRICLALRNSLFCWPLMIAGDAPDRRHGISLPVGLFLTRDGKSKTYFKIIRSKQAPPDPRRFQLPSTQTNWFATMEGSKLAWDRDWGAAPGVGMDAAKALWRTQNGRLRFADEELANERLSSSLVVDMGSACEIVDSVFKDLPNSRYVMTGQSAEAYWTQAVLGMLLPEGQTPHGVVTGRIEAAEGAFEIRWVEGIDKKLEYANNAGFSRVILPGSEIDECQVEVSDGRLAGTRDRQRVDHAVKAFLEGLIRSGRRKAIEINFCPTARSAADAMQPSGWRRTAFVRLPATQHRFSLELRRLYVHARHTQQLAMTREDLELLRSDPWTIEEEAAMEGLDARLLSRSHAIQFVERATFETDAELVIGKWLAWKDNQVRSGLGPQTRMRAPGLGILCLRTTDTDNEMRLWSTIADTLTADAAWWNRFQWSSRNEAAQALGDLLNNRSADPSICATSAPDLVVIFDEGNFTQRRTNQIFPDDFRGQMVDLLNPRRDHTHAVDPLDEELLRAGSAANGCLGTTRVLVVYGKSRHKDIAIPESIAPVLVDHLARLSVFRFGISKQAAYSMLNFERNDRERLDWTAAQETIDELIRLRALYSTRGQLYIRPGYLPVLHQFRYANDPRAHVHAAKALVPILEPERVFVASNRDRALEPEPMLEAIWHLRRARHLTTGREFIVRPQCDTALSTLVFLRTYPDWDTVKELERFPATTQDAVELGRELLELERWTTRIDPHTSRVAALLHAIGRRASSAVSAIDRVHLVEEACKRMQDSMSSLESLGPEDARRQKRKLLSEFLYCMKSLEVPDSDSRLTGATVYLKHTVNEIVKPDFYAGLDTRPDKLDSFPLSRDWFKVCWSDEGLPLAMRSRYAYAASRRYIGHRIGDEVVRDAWEQPWIEYFALTSPADLAPPQLKNPLASWRDLYAGDTDTARSFGQRVRDLWPYRSKFSRDKAEKVAWWRLKVQDAMRNLWAVTRLPPQRALPPEYADTALQFIDAVAMRETIPAFEFLESLEDDRIEELNQHRTSSLPGARAFAGSVLSSHAGWVSMLAKINAHDENANNLACAWLGGYLACGSELTKADPEGLLDLPSGRMQIVDLYRQRRQRAIWNGYQLLACGKGDGPAIYGAYRQALRDILTRIDEQSNSWFFAIAKSKPSRQATPGASLMLREVPTESIEAVCTAPKLQPFRESILRNIPQWLDLAAGRDLQVFMSLRQSMLR